MDDNKFYKSEQMSLLIKFCLAKNSITWKEAAAGEYGMSTNDFLTARHKTLRSDACLCSSGDLEKERNVHFKDRKLGGSPPVRSARQSPSTSSFRSKINHSVHTSAPPASPSCDGILIPDTLLLITPTGAQHLLLPLTAPQLIWSNSLPL